MSTATNGNPNPLTQLSEALADAVASAASSTVHVDARHRYGATGMIWSADGLIVTANHFIDRGDETPIKVVLPDGNEVTGELAGRDIRTDLAAIRVQASGLTPVTPAGGTPRVGHFVLAIGRPSSGATTASFGLISSLEAPLRQWRRRASLEVIRSDATLYPGFSGGPLVDTEGHVLGLNTSALGRGYGVTLPYSFVDRIVSSLVSHGTVGRGYLGIAAQSVELPQTLREKAGVSQERGLMVIALENDSPADKAGLLIGDILLSFGGQETTDFGELQEQIGPETSGAKRQAKVLRGGQLAEFEVTIGSRPARS
ncbi:MAG TPA: trypsin-like peptidase domain-containing protein [Thermomicrobiaceae bacterium]|nr:trypsin-like peptidase domain-containing protein [Thermomicrobiaceae bacterium]